MKRQITLLIAICLISAAAWAQVPFIKGGIEVATDKHNSYNSIFFNAGSGNYETVMGDILPHGFEVNVNAQGIVEISANDYHDIFSLNTQPPVGIQLKVTDAPEGAFYYLSLSDLSEKKAHYDVSANDTGYGPDIWNRYYRQARQRLVVNFISFGNDPLQPGFLGHIGQRTQYVLILDQQGNMLEVREVTLAASIHSPTDVMELDADAGIRVYPNPTSGAYTLWLNGISNNAETWAEVIGIRGERIMRTRLDSNQQLHQFSLEGQAPGLYLIRLIIDGKQAGMERILKK